MDALRESHRRQAFSGFLPGMQEHQQGHPQNQQLLGQQQLLQQQQLQQQQLQQLQCLQQQQAQACPSIPENTVAASMGFPQQQHMSLPEPEQKHPALHNSWHPSSTSMWCHNHSGLSASSPTQESNGGTGMNAPSGATIPSHMHPSIVESSTVTQTAAEAAAAASAPAAEASAAATAVNVQTSSVAAHILPRLGHTQVAENEAGRAEAPSFSEVPFAMPDVLATPVPGVETRHPEPSSELHLGAQPIRAGLVTQPAYDSKALAASTMVPDFGHNGVEPAATMQGADPTAPMPESEPAMAAAAVSAAAIATPLSEPAAVDTGERATAVTSLAPGVSHGHPQVSKLSLEQLDPAEGSGSLDLDDCVPLSFRDRSQRKQDDATGGPLLADGKPQESVHAVGATWAACSGGNAVEDVSTLATSNQLPPADLAKAPGSRVLEAADSDSPKDGSNFSFLDGSLQHPCTASSAASQQKLQESQQQPQQLSERKEAETSPETNGPGIPIQQTWQQPLAGIAGGQATEAEEPQGSESSRAASKQQQQQQEPPINHNERAPWLRQGTAKHQAQAEMDEIAGSEDSDRISAVPQTSTPFAAQGGRAVPQQQTSQQQVPPWRRVGITAAHAQAELDEIAGSDDSEDLDNIGRLPPRRTSTNHSFTSTHSAAAAPSTAKGVNGGSGKLEEPGNLVASVGASAPSGGHDSDDEEEEVRRPRRGGVAASKQEEQKPKAGIGGSSSRLYADLDDESDEDVGMLEAPTPSEGSGSFGRRGGGLGVLGARGSGRGRGMRSGLLNSAGASGSAGSGSLSGSLASLRKSQAKPKGSSLFGGALDWNQAF